VQYSLWYVVHNTLPVGDMVTEELHYHITDRQRIGYNIPESVFFFSWRYKPHCGCILQPSSGALASSLKRFLDHTQRRATIGRTPLDEWSVRRTDLYLTTHNTHNRQTSMPWVGFKPTIAAGERP